MILEAFAQHLRAQTGSRYPQASQKPEQILYEWLLDRLSVPPEAIDPIGNILHTEIAIRDCNGHYILEGRSDTGHRLLNSLYQFCRSYDHWQFSRWVHEVRASDFKKFGS